VRACADAAAAAAAVDCRTLVNVKLICVLPTTAHARGRNNFASLVNGQRLEAAVAAAEAAHRYLRTGEKGDGGGGEEEGKEVKWTLMTCEQASERAHEYLQTGAAAAAAASVAYLNKASIFPPLLGLLSSAVVTAAAVAAATAPAQLESVKRA